ncbi:MAG: DUF2796 domain-containing protein [bacterium]|jgi:hypothetical protein
MKQLSLLLIIFLYGVLKTLAQGSLEAHVHGKASLNLVLDGQSLFIEFESPAYNLVGFEHEPKDQIQQKEVQDTLSLLSRPRKVFGFSAQAGCLVESVSVTTTMAGVGKNTVGYEEEHHEEEHHEEEHHEEEHHDHSDGDSTNKESHSEFKANYLMICSEPEKLRTIEFKLFKEFLGLKSVQVQWINGEGQGYIELNAESSKLKW